MLLCFFGFLIVFTELPIGVPTGELDLLPTFLGYLLLLLGSMRAKGESKHFSRLQLASLIALPFGLAGFVLDIFASLVPVAPTVLFVLTTVANIYCAYEFAEGAREIERRYFKKLGADRLFTAWGILGMTSLFGFLLAIFTEFGLEKMVTNLALTQMVLQVIALILFEISSGLFVRNLRRSRR